MPLRAPRCTLRPSLPMLAGVLLAVGGCTCTSNQVKTDVTVRLDPATFQSNETVYVALVPLTDAELPAWRALDAQGYFSGAQPAGASAKPIEVQVSRTSPSVKVPATQWATGGKDQLTLYVIANLPAPARGRDSATTTLDSCEWQSRGLSGQNLDVVITDSTVTIAGVKARK